MDEAFRRDVLANPADDAPRLVYADWLDEHGDAPRAEFIRVQVEHARLDPDDERRWLLARRVEALAQEHGKRWCAGLPAWEGGVSWLFRRGFVSGVVAAVEPFLAGVEDLRRLIPLEFADLRRTRGSRLKELAEGDALAGLNGLALWEDHHLGLEEVRLLAHCPHLGTLRSLELTSQGISNAGVRALVEAPTLGPLECLYLQHNFIGRMSGGEPLDLRPLVESHHRESLTALYINGNELDRGSYAHLGSFPNLRAVTLGGVDSAAAKVLARLPGLSSWRALMITICPGRVETVRALTGSPHLTGLVALELSHGDFTDATARVLADCPHLAGLRHLNLEANHIHDAGVQAISGSPHLAGLAELDLRYNKITRAGAEALAAGAFRNLRRLDVRGNRIGQDGVAALCERFGEGLSAEQEGSSEDWPLRRLWDLRGVCVRG